MVGGAIAVSMPLLSGNVIVLDYRRLSREALCRLLEALSFSVIGEGKTLADVLGDGALKGRPDLIVHNFESDAEAEHELPSVLQARTHFEGLKSVLLTDCVRAEMLTKAMHAGVEAILSKDISANVLQRSLEIILLGQRMFPSGLAQALLESGEPPKADVDPPPPNPEQRRVTTLSEREHQILQCLVEGLPNKAIARELDITEATVKVHVKGLLRKTCMANRTQAAVWALSKSLQSDATAAGIGTIKQAMLAGQRGARSGPARSTPEKRKAPPAVFRRVLPELKRASRG
jgi:two-component system nitrate/nitrite response regulator NarL